MTNRLFLGSALLLAACGGTVPDGGPDPSVAATPSSPPPSRAELGPRPQAEPRGPYAGAIATTDVSILFPLPSGDGDLLAPTALGSHGPLLARATFDRLVAAGTVETDPVRGSYDALRVVSVRLDPCSRRSGGCEPEVRVVYQGIYAEQGQSFAADGAVHAFYRLEPGELEALVAQLSSLKQANGGLGTQELTVHPILAKQGLNGPFAIGLEKLLENFIGDDRARRVTFFDHHDGGEIDAWSFGALDRVDGVWVTQSIPELGAKQRQTITGSAAKLDALNVFGGASVDVGATELAGLLVGSGKLDAPARASFAQSVRLQNPSLHDAENTNCASCHLAEGVRRSAELRFGLAAGAVPGGFTHERSLARDDVRSSITNLHMFGYLGRDVAIMQRTANESVLVADAIAKMTPN